MIEIIALIYVWSIAFTIDELIDDYDKVTFIILVPLIALGRIVWLHWSDYE